MGTGKAAGRYEINEGVGVMKEAVDVGEREENKGPAALVVTILRDISRDSEGIISPTGELVGNGDICSVTEIKESNF